MHSSAGPGGGSPSPRPWIPSWPHSWVRSWWQRSLCLGLERCSDLSWWESPRQHSSVSSERARPLGRPPGQRPFDAPVLSCLTALGPLELVRRPLTDHWLTASGQHRDPWAGPRHSGEASTILGRGQLRQPCRRSAGSHPHSCSSVSGAPSSIMSEVGLLRPSSSFIP